MRSLTDVLAMVCVVLAGSLGYAREQTADERASPTSRRRAVILGFDGMDPERCRTFMAQGRMPNFQRLAATGEFAELDTTNPAQSPTAWATLNTGMNPGKTRVFDFLTRDPDTRAPLLALARRAERPFPVSRVYQALLCVGAGALIGACGWFLMRTRATPGAPKWRLAAAVLLAAAVAGAGISAGREWLPDHLPAVDSQVQGTPFWEILARHGTRSTVLQAPMAFPARAGAGWKLLTGLGTPDLQGSPGFWSFYTTNEARLPTSRAGHEFTPTTTGGQVFALSRGTMMESVVIGPENFFVPTDPRPRLIVPLRFERRSDTMLRIHLDGRSYDVAVNEWSPWCAVTFAFSPLLKAHGILRFSVRRVTPEVEVYATPVNFDPRAPPATAPIANPPEFAGALARQLGGPFATLGWSIATHARKDGYLDDAGFDDSADGVFAARRALWRGQLPAPDWDCLFAVFYHIDRISHMYWSDTEAGSSRPPEGPARAAQARIAAAYAAADEVLGELLARHADDHTLILAVSDHGFAGFRKGFNINAWLSQHGYLVLKDGRDATGTLHDLGGDALARNVDWARTRAYSLGLGKIYFNLEGREQGGIVRPGAETQRLFEELRRGLRDFRDPETGAPVVHEVYHRAQLYDGPYVEESADLVLGFARGYRVSWQSALGGDVTGAVLSANTEPWCGDHCSVDPALVPGVLFSNRRLTMRERRPHLHDVAPTLLQWFGVTPPADMDGVNLIVAP